MMEVGDRSSVHLESEVPVSETAAPAPAPPIKISIEKGGKASRNKHTMLMRRPSMKIMEKNLVRQQTIHNIDTSVIKLSPHTLSPHTVTPHSPFPHSPTPSPTAESSHLTVSFQVSQIDENFTPGATATAAAGSSSLSSAHTDAVQHPSSSSDLRPLERTKSMFGMKKNLNTLKSSTIMMMDEPARSRPLPLPSNPSEKGKGKEKEKEKGKEAESSGSGPSRKRLMFQDEEE
jgi:hypothetical protein